MPPIPMISGGSSLSLSFYVPPISLPLTAKLSDERFTLHADGSGGS